jgi:hypothetical protein
MLKENIGIHLIMNALSKVRETLQEIRDHFIQSSLLSVGVLTPNPYILKY